MNTQKILTKAITNGSIDEVMKNLSAKMNIPVEDTITKLTNRGTVTIDEIELIAEELKISPVEYYDYFFTL